MQVLASAMAQSTPCSVAFITHSAHQVGISFQQPSSCFSRHDHNLAPYTRGLLPRRMDAMETSSSLLDGIPVSEESIEMALIQRFGRLKGLASRIPSLVQGTLSTWLERAGVSFLAVSSPPVMQRQRIGGSGECGETSVGEAGLREGQKGKSSRKRRARQPVQVRSMRVAWYCRYDEHMFATYSLGTTVKHRPSVKGRATPDVDCLSQSCLNFHVVPVGWIPVIVSSCCHELATRHPACVPAAVAVTLGITS